MYHDTESGRTFLAVANRILYLNPITRTNDRHELAVEFDRPVASQTRLRFAILRHDEPDVVVAQDEWMFNPGVHEGPPQWVYFPIASLPPHAWKAQRPHTLRLWVDGTPAVQRPIIVDFADEQRITIR